METVEDYMEDSRTALVSSVALKILVLVSLVSFSILAGESGLSWSWNYQTKSWTGAFVLIFLLGLIWYQSRTSSSMRLVKSVLKRKRETYSSKPHNLFLLVDDENGIVDLKTSSKERIGIVDEKRFFPEVLSVNPEVTKEITTDEEKIEVIECKLELSPSVDLTELLLKYVSEDYRKLEINLMDQAKTELNQIFKKDWTMISLRAVNITPSISEDRLAREINFPAPFQLDFYGEELEKIPYNLTEVTLSRV